MGHTNLHIQFLYIYSVYVCVHVRFSQEYAMHFYSMRAECALEKVVRLKRDINIGTPYNG